VDRKRLSNGKKKGENDRKNGNQYLAWAYLEAANFAICYHDPVKRFYRRKSAKINGVVPIKAVAHKLARANYYVMREQRSSSEPGVPSASIGYLLCAAKSGRAFAPRSGRAPSADRGW